MEIGLLLTAFVIGFAAWLIGLPPLVGYLAAGFALHALGYETTGGLETIADVGIYLLLFGIGLKLRPQILIRAEVWATATLFAAGSTLSMGAVLLGLGAIGLPLLNELDVGSAAVVAFALSFSSTVFAVKTLEATNETGSVAGRVAIAILVLQDIFAVAFLVIADGQVPSPWAVLLIPGFFVLRPVAGWFLDRSGHGEVLVLFGLALAVGVGAGAFDAVGMKPDLGALAAGLVLSQHPRAGEVAERLLAFKDIFLVAFFLSIGLAGTPPWEAWVVGAVLLVALPVRGFGHFWLFTRFRLRARTAVQGAINLSTFSEFGLIVGAAALSADLLSQDWVSTIAVAVAGSFIAGAAATQFRYETYEAFSSRISRFERQPTLESDAIVDCHDARIVVFGMGRVGTGAFDELVGRRGRIVVGVDRETDMVVRHQQEGRFVLHGDPLDRDFWDRVQFHADVELVVASTSNHAANLEVINRVKRFLPAARIAAIATYPDQIGELRAAGVDVARNLYEEAGQALADDAISEVFDED